jgi:hypothetical protein
MDDQMMDDEEETKESKKAESIKKQLFLAVVTRMP